METKSVESQSSGGPVKQRLKINKWAKTSFWCGLFALGLPIAILLFIDTLFFMTLPLSFSTKRILRAVFDQIIVVGSPVLAITALVSGVVGLLRIILKKGTIKGAGKAIGGILLSLLFFAFVLFMGMSVRVRHRAAEMHCLQNLTDLGKAMRMYANDYNGRYPTAGKWCDLLVEHAGIRERRLLCTESGGKRGDFYYAINQNTELNSPGDMVLLFEGYGGWNQFGGPERLTTGNHFPNRCNVLFNDGHAESVKKKQLGDLRWKVEEGDGVREGFFK